VAKPGATGPCLRIQPPGSPDLPSRGRKTAPEGALRALRGRIPWCGHGEAPAIGGLPALAGPSVIYLQDQSIQGYDIFGPEIRPDVATREGLQPQTLLSFRLYSLVVPACAMRGPSAR
jgi:hypothetical protein